MSNNSRRIRHRHQRASKRGQAPGTAVYVGETRDVPVEVNAIDFDGDGLRAFDALSDDVHARATADGSVTWINLDGIHDAENVKAVASRFDLHPLWVEDLLNPACRPRSEVIGDKLLVIAKMARVIVAPDGTAEVDTEQVGMVCGPNWVLTFQERPGDVWNGVRQRIENNSRIRKMGPSYLFHGLLDAIVDEYFGVLEHLEAEVDKVEEESLGASVAALPPRLYAVRTEITAIRTVIWPVREAVGQLVRGEFEGLDPDVAPFYRDLYDHLMQTMDIADATRERLVSVVELHLALTSHQMNVVMRLLTVVSTVFIPLTFIVGVYGMNFEYMPELAQPYGYALTWVVMVAIAGALLAMFWRWGWLRAAR